MYPNSSQIVHKNRTLKKFSLIESSSSNGKNSQMHLARRRNSSMTDKKPANGLASKNSSKQFIINRPSANLLIHSKSDIITKSRSSLAYQKTLICKKSYLGLWKNKPRTYSIELAPALSYEQQLRHSTTLSNCHTSNEEIELAFSAACIRLQDEYRGHCDKGDYSKAWQCLVSLLNYSIDISSRAWFCKVVLVMCQYYEILDQAEPAVKLYTQLKESALLLCSHRHLVIALIGIARIGSNYNLLNQSVLILQKALEYAWYIGDRELESTIYDELGEKYYKMGDLAKAGLFHQKYSQGQLEAADSMLRSLTRQQINNLEEKNLAHKYENLCENFLTHLKLPVKSIQSLPKLLSGVCSSRQNLNPNQLSLVSSRGASSSVEWHVRKLLGCWVFENKPSQLSLHTEQSVNLNKSASTQQQRKNVYYDFKLNQHLRSKGIKVVVHSQSFMLRGRGSTPGDGKKLNLDQKIKKLLNEPGLEKEWYENMVKRVQNDQKRKLSDVSDKILLTKYNAKSKQRQEAIKGLFKHIMDYLSSNKITEFEKLF